MRKPAQTFQDLLVWQHAHAFVLDAYKYSKEFPKFEAYGLTSQFRRASVSIAANIAEGFKKRRKKDKRKFLNIAQGSLEECRYYLILANDLRYGENKPLVKKLQSTSKLLDAYCKAILNSDS